MSTQRQDPPHPAWSHQPSRFIRFGFQKNNLHTDAINSYWHTDLFFHISADQWLNFLEKMGPTSCWCWDRAPQGSWYMGESSWWYPPVPCWGMLPAEPLYSSYRAGHSLAKSSLLSHSPLSCRLQQFQIDSCGTFWVATGWQSSTLSAWWGGHTPLPHPSFRGCPKLCHSTGGKAWESREREIASYTSSVLKANRQAPTFHYARIISRNFSRDSFMQSFNKY